MLRIARIPGFDGYGVSQDGRVWSNKVQGSGTKHRSNWVRLKTHLNTCSYPALSLRVSTQQQTHVYTVHKLMAYVFFRLPLSGAQLQVNHKDGIKTNNQLENLEVVTASENMQHAWRLGLRKPVSFLVHKLTHK